MASLLTPLKLQPWAPICLFILKCELSNHPDRAFVKQLSYNLQQGCTIGNNGPKFANFAYQQPEVIDAALKKYEAGRILGSFSNPLLSNFRISRLGLA